jgi:hypothetical protein
MKLNVFRANGRHSIRRLLDLVLERRMAVLAVVLQRHLRRFALVQPFVKRFHSMRPPPDPFKEPVNFYNNYNLINNQFSLFEFRFKQLIVN